MRTNTIQTQITYKSVFVDSECVFIEVQLVGEIRQVSDSGTYVVHLINNSGIIAAFDSVEEAKEFVEINERVPLNSFEYLTGVANGFYKFSALR